MSKLESDYLSHIPSFLADAPYTHNNTGEVNHVLFVDTDLLLKIPRSFPKNKGVLFEGLIVAELDRKQEPPLEIPSLIDCHPHPPAYNLFRRVEGEALSVKDVLALSTEEKYELGRKIGEFVTWMSGALDFPTYQQIIRDVDSITLSNRLSWLSKYAITARADAALDPALAEMLLDLGDEQRDLHAQGLLQPTIIGHDDLRPDNLTFIQHEDKWHPHGVIDFGITQPSRPERELRHVASLGDEARTGAIEGYEETSGKKIDHQLLSFWTRAQLIQTTAYGYLLGDRDFLEKKQCMLQVTIPEIDWSYLTTSPDHRNTVTSGQ